MSKITFQIKRVETVELTAHFRIGDQTGFVKLDAFVRTPEQMKESAKELQRLAEADDKVGMLKLNYAAIRGLGDEKGPIEGDAAFEFVANGEYSMYLFAGVFSRYHEHFAEANVTQVKRGNARG